MNQHKKHPTPMNIREACLTDKPRILELVRMAREIMCADGNPTQWPEGKPSEETIEQDIAQHVGRGVVDDNGQMVAYFAYLEGPDPTYARIYDGEWLDHSPYHVIHRVASSPDSHGVFSAIMDYVWQQGHNIRIDTHRDNRIMHHLLAQEGFTRCGIIHLENGEERVAFQKCETTP